MRGTLIGGVAAMVLLAGTGAAVKAHHSPAMFDTNDERVLSGTVRVFQWTNPHCYIQLVVRKADGTQEEWSMEMGAPFYLQNRGWKRNSIKPGDSISVSHFPLRSGRHGGLVTEVRGADGKVIGAV